MKTHAVTTAITTCVPAALTGFRNNVTIYNGGATVVTLQWDGSTVALTAANGIPLAAGASKDIVTASAVNVISAVGGETLRIQGVD